MARARNIKPGFFESEDPAKVGYPQRLLWIALWTLADREGRLEYRPATFKKYAFGFDAVTVEEVRDWVSELASVNLIDIYNVGSTQVIQVVNFHKHQRPHKFDPPSIYPPKILNGGTSPVILSSPPVITGETPLNGGTSPVKCLSTEAFPRLNVECRMLNVEWGMGNGAHAPSPPPPKRLVSDTEGPDPDELFQQAAKFACEQLPAGGDVGQTAAAMRLEFQKSASFEGNPAGFCLSFTGSVRKWRAAYDNNPDLRTKQAQWWTRDGTYAQAPPAPRAPRRFGPVDLKAGQEVDDGV